MTEYDYEGKFSDRLMPEEKAALMWKIEQDYRSSDFKAVSFKDEYITFAVNFYTRNIYSLEDVVEQYRAFSKAQMRRDKAAAFMADLRQEQRLRQFELLG